MISVILGRDITLHTENLKIEVIWNRLLEKIDVGTLFQICLSIRKCKKYFHF